jgi:hypothetical protein
MISDMMSEEGIIETFDFCRLPSDVRTLILSYLFYADDKCQARYVCRQMRDDADQFISWSNMRCVRVIRRYVSAPLVVL